MKKLLFLMIMTTIVSTLSNCKKKQLPPQPVCVDDRHFEGTYICTNLIVGLKNDTIKITFNNMDSNCKKVMTIKGFGYIWNHANTGCPIIGLQDYTINDHCITVTNSNIYDNVLQLTTTVNVQDISINICNGNQLDFKKIN